MEILIFFQNDFSVLSCQGHLFLMFLVQKRGWITLVALFNFISLKCHIIMCILYTHGRKQQGCSLKEKVMKCQVKNGNEYAIVVSSLHICLSSFSLSQLKALFFLSSAIPTGMTSIFIPGCEFYTLLTTYSKFMQQMVQKCRCVQYFMFTYLPFAFFI